MTNVKDYYNKLVELNEKGKSGELSFSDANDQMAELMIQLQKHLIQKRYMTDEIRRTQDSLRNYDAREAVDIFVRVRDEFQPYDQPCEDFSYISVAWDWLTSNGETLMNDKESASC